ncbi:MAG TPA: hypothetical protein VNU46_07270, partial [Gemmatimonadaceae bacterium]|nr:hypothetical protein [Gemmatimonadaceae bacterium]
MTAFERVRRTQRSLQVIIGSSVLFWAAAILFGLLTIGAVLGALVALPPAVRGLIPIIAALAALITFGLLAWRGRFAWSFERVALWIEERLPELRYALVTAIDPRYQGSAAKLMEPAINRADPGPFVWASARRSTLPAALALLVAVGAFMEIPTRWRDKINAGNFFDTLKGKPAIVGNRLVPLTGTLTPPAYTHLRTETLTEPSMITGLVGSKVVLTGSGSPDGIQVTLTEFPSEESVNAPLGDSANDDSEQYEEAQQAAQQKQGSGTQPYDQNGVGGAQGMGMPGMPGGGMSRPDESGMHQNTPDDQGGLGNRGLGGAGLNGARGMSQPAGQSAQPTKPSKPTKTPPAKPRARPVARQQAKPLIVKTLPVTAGGKGWIVT